MNTRPLLAPPPHTFPLVRLVRGRGRLNNQPLLTAVNGFIQSRHHILSAHSTHTQSHHALPHLFLAPCPPTPTTTSHLVLPFLRSTRCRWPGTGVNSLQGQQPIHANHFYTSSPTVYPFQHFHAYTDSSTHPPTTQSGLRTDLFTTNHKSCLLETVRTVN